MKRGHGEESEQGKNSSNLFKGRSEKRKRGVVIIHEDAGKRGLTGYRLKSGEKCFALFLNWA